MKPKIIVVAYAMGRTGSSALMGSLRHLGCCVGAEDNLVKPHAMNVKGFFELKAQKHFLERVFQGIYPDVTEPPSIRKLDELGDRYFNDYESILQQKFEFSPIAVKSQRMLTLPLLHRLKDRYDIKVLIINRNLQDQAHSIKGVWDNTKNESYSFQYIEQWLKRWRIYASELEQYYPFDYFHISFEELLAQPMKICETITEFAGLPRAEETSISQWIDTSLVNRNKNQIS